MQSAAFHESARRASQAEAALIGCALKHPPALDEPDVSAVRPEDFREEPYRIVWEAIRALYMAGRPTDPVNVYDRILSTSAPGSFPWETGSPAPLLAVLHDSCASPSSAGYYAGIVRDCALLRALALVGHQIAALAESPTGPAQEALASAESLLFRLAESGVEGAARPLAEAVREAMERIAERIDNPASGGVPTGLTGLDNLTAGLHPGELVVLAARPSVGKTAVAVSIARNVADCSGPVLFSSIEQADHELATRLLVAASGVQGGLVRHGTLSRETFSGVLVPWADRVGRTPLHIDSAPSQDVLRVASNARRLKRRVGLKLVVVDYLQLLTPEDKSVPRHEQVAETSRRLKALARELEVPVLALAQLNREVEGRQDKKPRLSDLRESGQVEQDADVVVLMHRADEEGPKVALELNVAKQRNGPVGICTAYFDRDRMRFSDLEAF